MNNGNTTDYDGSTTARTDIETDHLWLSEDQPSTAIIQAVAQRKGTEPLDLPPLYEYVDPEAIDSLLLTAAENDNASIEVQFDYLEHTITITSDGHFSISDNATTL